MKIESIRRFTRHIATRSIHCALSLLLALTTIAAQVSPAQAQGRRVALVIGNSRYEDGVTALSNPANDATDVADALRAMNFEVTALYDLSESKFRKALQKFSRDAGTANTALVFYAGHAMHLDDESYLMPIGVKVEDKADVKFEMVSVENDIIRLALADVPVRILILDACRDNPIAQHIAMVDKSRSISEVRGLAPIVQPASGTLIAYATSPNQVAEDGLGRNSPFTKALKKHIAEPGVDVQTMLAEVSVDVRQDTNDRQRPEISDALPRGFFLSPGESDAVVWDGIKATHNVAELKDFTRRFPTSQHVGEANAKIEVLLVQEQFELFKREAAQRDEAARRQVDEARAAAAALQKADAAAKEAAHQQAIADAEAKRLVAEQDTARKEEQRRAEADRIAAARAEAARQEAARQDTIKAAAVAKAADAARQETARKNAARLAAEQAVAIKAADEARQEAIRIEAQRRAAEDTARQEAARVEVARMAAVKAEAARQQALQVELARQAAAKAAESERQAAILRQASEREIAAKAAAAKEAAAEVEAARIERVHQEAVKQAAAEAEAARQEAARQMELQVQAAAATHREAERIALEKATALAQAAQAEKQRQEAEKAAAAARQPSPEEIARQRDKAEKDREDTAQAQAVANEATRQRAEQAEQARAQIEKRRREAAAAAAEAASEARAARRAAEAKAAQAKRAVNAASEAHQAARDVAIRSHHMERAEAQIHVDAQSSHRSNGVSATTKNRNCFVFAGESHCE